MNDPEFLLESTARLKLARANEHLDAINAEIRSFFDIQPYVLAAETNPESGEHLRRVAASDQPPVVLSLMVGDALHNLRSALDHLIWERSAPEKRHPKTGFPLLLESSQFGKDQANLLIGLSDRDRAIVEELQPYQAGDRLDARATPLRVLHDLDIADKHKFLHLTGLVMEGSTLVVSAMGGTIVEQETFPGPFEDGAILARVVVTPPEAKVDMHFGATFDIAFTRATTPWELPVGTSLAILRDAVTNALDRFSTSV